MTRVLTDSFERWQLSKSLPPSSFLYICSAVERLKSIQQAKPYVPSKRYYRLFVKTCFPDFDCVRRELCQKPFNFVQKTRQTSYKIHIYNFVTFSRTTVDWKVATFASTSQKSLNPYSVKRNLSGWKTTTEIKAIFFRFQKLRGSALINIWMGDHQESSGLSRALKTLWSHHKQSTTSWLFPTPPELHLTIKAEQHNLELSGIR